MEYSAKETRTYRETRVSYGILNGNSTVVFVKVGRGGTVYGENDLHPDVYLRLAHEINRRYGYTVIVSDNPTDEKNPNPLEYDMRFIGDLARFSGRGFSVDYVGFSAGADYGAWFGHLFPEIRRMLLINPIVNLNTHKLKECCQKFDGAISFLFGENDASAKYASVIPTDQKIGCAFLPGERHVLKDGVLTAEVLRFLDPRR